jgi:hypothetical protein
MPHNWVAVWQKQTQSQKSVRRGLTQRNSSGLLKPLEGVALMRALRILQWSLLPPKKRHACPDRYGMLTGCAGASPRHRFMSVVEHRGHEWLPLRDREPVTDACARPQAAVKVWVWLPDLAPGSFKWAIMGKIHRAINLVMALALVVTGGAGLVYFYFISDTWSPWLAAAAGLVGFAGLYWLWDEHINAGPRASGER